MNAPLTSRIRRVWRRLTAPWHRPAIDREMSDEMRFHIDMEVRDLVEQGVARPEAERIARARFGGVERFKDEGRDVRGSGWLADGVQDLRFA
jgi:putative ABC transport system permease protein